MQIRQKNIWAYWRASFTLFENKIPKILSSRAFTTTRRWIIINVRKVGYFDLHRVLAEQKQRLGLHVNWIMYAMASK